METLGQRIAKARKTLPGGSDKVAHMTAKELGALVGMEGNTVSQWETDKKKRPSMGTIEKFAEALNVRVEWLRTGAGPMRDGDSETIDTSDADDVPIDRDEEIERLVADWPEAAKRDVYTFHRSIGDEMDDDLWISGLRKIAKKHAVTAEFRFAKDAERGVFVERSDLGNEQRL